jgi:hypothetical protein
MTSSVRIGLATLLLAAAVVPRASAQTEDYKFALGGDFGVKAASEHDARGGLGIGFLWRIGKSKTGWGFKYGLNWFAEDVTQPVAGLETVLGEIRIRPIMGGYGYTKVMGQSGRSAVSAHVMGGYAFSSFTLAPSAADTYRDRLGAQSLGVDVSNTFVVKPEIGYWYDLNRKVGVHLSAGFMVARPKLTVSNSLGSGTERLRADIFMFKVGAVYKIF